MNLAGFDNDVSNFQFPNIQVGNVVIGDADIRFVGGELELIAGLNLLMLLIYN